MFVPRFSRKRSSGVSNWSHVKATVHRRLPWLIFGGVLAGVLCGWQFRRVIEPPLRPGDYQTLDNESQRGKSMPILVRFRSNDDINALMAKGQLDIDDTNIAALLIPDQLMSRTLCNSAGSASRGGGSRTTQQPFLDGTLEGIRRIEKATAGGPNLIPASLHLSGRLVACKEGSPQTLAEGLKLTIQIVDGPPSIKRPDIGKWVSRLPITVMDAAGDIFRKVLLMIFLPLLAITFLRTPLESKTIANIRKLGMGLLLANVGVAIIGLLIGAGVATGFRHLKLGPDQIKAQLGVDGEAAEVPYEAHPAISAITHLIPSNPLGSLGDATGNNAMQILLLAGTVGVLLSFANDAIKSQAAKVLKQGAAFLVPDHLYSSKSLMDFVQPLIPFGVFCLTASLACTMRMNSIKVVMGGSYCPRCSPK